MIKIKNIYYMLSYAYQSLNNSTYSSLRFEDFENSQDLFAALISIGINTQIKRGLFKNYIDHSEVLNTIKGKLLLSETLKSNNIIYNRASCSFDSFSDNIYMNQIIKSTMLMLLKSDNVKKEQKSSLKKSLILLREITEISLSSVQWSSLKYNKNNSSYKTLINICYLAYTQLIYTNSLSGITMQVPIEPQCMYNLYEKFVLEYFKKHFPQFQPKSSFIDWATDDNIIDLLPRMKTDITLTTINKTLIIDTKYYDKTLQYQDRFDSKSLHSNNLYQIFTYVKNMSSQSTNIISGMLLYAKTDEDLIVNNTYSMSGNTIYVKTLDLNQNFNCISTELNNLIELWLKN